MPTVAELIAQRAELDKMIADVQREERSSAIAQAKALMSQYNLTVADLGSKSTTSSSRSSGPRAGGKVAAKYRDPETGREWTGRGLKPKWVVAALASGKSLADLAV